MRKLSLLVMLAVCATLARAADPNSAIVPVQPVAAAAPANPALHGPNEFSFWAGATANEPNIIALTGDRRVSIVGLRYGRRLYQGRLFAVTYTFDLLPAVVVSQPRNVLGKDTTGHELIYGAGFSPLGFRFDLRPRHRVQPFVGFSGGGVGFTRPAPFSDAAKFNFLAALDCGVQVFQHSGHALTFGYKLHHISNAARVRDNPGIDSNMFYTAFSFFK
ncbi:MAG TPA: acyloxyacyl hydrolase [Terriglobales bacterium]|nr:acyloxyacyl hydrolase [Terriglobales bacterium]